MDEKIKRIWGSDRLERHRDAEFLYDLAIGRNAESIRSNSGSVVLNVNAPWGQGKSFFLEGLYKEVLERKHPAVFINAWQFDFVDDPYSICVAALDEYFAEYAQKADITVRGRIAKGLSALRENSVKVVGAVTKGVAKSLINKVTANGFDEISELLQASKEKSPEGEETMVDAATEAAVKEVGEITDSLIDKVAKFRIEKINESKRSVIAFQDGLASLIKTMGSQEGNQFPMFIFIDELDRCRPTYAIEMLERIKHIFNVPNLVFIIATDTQALSHSVNAVYGNEFKSLEYLSRFFHRTYSLPLGHSETIIAEMLDARGTDRNKWLAPLPDEGLGPVSLFLSQTAVVFGLDLRRTKSAVEMLMDVTAAWSAPYALELTYMFSLICHYIGTGKLDMSAYSRGIHGSNLLWQVEKNGVTLACAEVIDEIRKHTSTLSDAIATISKNGGGIDLSIAEKYVLHLLRREKMVKKPQGDNTLATLRYIGLIEHARRLN